MTNSILLEIYNDLEGMACTYVDKSGASTTPNCFDLSEIPSTVSTAQLPCRILLPIGQGKGGSDNVEVLRGAGIKARWNVTDLFLLEASARDMGLYVLAPVLMRYVVAYSEALGKQFQFIDGWNTESLTISAAVVPGMYEYPTGSGSWFYGVKCDVTVEEIF